MTYVIFDQRAYEDLKGGYGKHSALEPIKLANGIEYAVGVEVLNDKEFESIKTDLAKLPQRELTETDFYLQQ